MKVEEEQIKSMLDSAFRRLPPELTCRDVLEVKRYFGMSMMFAKADVDFEPSLASGRPDAVVKTEKAIYIVEFKYAQSAEAALAQCREKSYADAYVADGRRVVYVGVNYDPAVRTVDAVKTEVVRS